MAEITRRRTGELVRILFDVLIRHPEGLPAREALSAVEQRVQLSDFEKGQFPSGGRRFEKIVRFATVDCVKAGWLFKEKGRWIVTDAGRAIYQQITDPEKFYQEASRLYRRWKQSQGESAALEKDIPDEQSPKEASVTFEEADETAWQEIQEYVAAMPPYEFQELVADLLAAMGYFVTWIAPPGKDGGVDIVAWSDPLGTRPPRIKVQVKRQSSSLGVEGLRAFLANLSDDDVGIFVCTGGFSKDAADTARAQERRKVTLVHLERLVDLWVEYYGRLSDRARQRLTLRPIYFLAPRD
jgi:restriction system protein